MLDFLELEETVGRAWHRLAGNTGSYTRHPQSGVTLAEMRPVLGPLFRAFGGESTVQIAPARARSSSHRLRLRQYVGLGEEKIEESARDLQSLHLPGRIDLFEDRDLNRDLYVWLAGFMALMPRDGHAEDEHDLLKRDAARIRRSAETARRVMNTYPGLAAIYSRLAKTILATRTRSTLPRAEQAIENRIRCLLADAAGVEGPSARLDLPERAPPGYLPMLPVPLWPGFSARAETAPRTVDEPPVAAGVNAAEGGQRSAVRENPEKRQQELSPFVLNRFEKILSLSEMISVDRPVDDSDDDTAKTADDLEDMVLGERRGKPASRFRFDLDLPPETLDRSRLTTEITYPEWDYRTAAYLPDQVRVHASPALVEAEPEHASPETEALIRRVRRQFEVLRPRHVTMRAQLDGVELDLDQLVRRQADLTAGGQGTDRIHTMPRPRDHDLATTLLVDVSLSTDAWVDDRRVLDVEKEALLVLAQGLAACGDRFSVMSFTSRRRDWVRLETLKRFDEPMSSTVTSRIAGLKPGYYTRIGAAIRHAASSLKAETAKQKLLLILTDGKPNDVDYYEGRYALENTRQAVREARTLGISVFAVTIDKNAESYLPALFGRKGFALVGNLSRLPAALPGIYRGLVG